MAHKIVWEPKGVYKHFSGHVSFEEFARTQEQILADPRTDDIRYIINDFLDVESYSVVPDQVEYSAALNRGTSFSNPRIRIAVVTLRPGVRLLVKAAATISSLPLKDFSTLQQARAWAQEPH